VIDKPGVLHEISGIFGKHNISIASLIQHETENAAVLILTTHEAKEGDLLQSIQELETLQSVQGNVVRMRVQNT
jgi:homoserine dehydrogenase